MFPVVTVPPERARLILPPILSLPSSPGPLPAAFRLCAARARVSKNVDPVISKVPLEIFRPILPPRAEPFRFSPLPPWALAINCAAPPTTRSPPPLIVILISPPTASCPMPVPPLLRTVEKSSSPVALASTTRSPVTSNPLMIASVNPVWLALILIVPPTPSDPARNVRLPLPRILPPPSALISIRLRASSSRSWVPTVLLATIKSVTDAVEALMPFVAKVETDDPKAIFWN